MQKKDLEKMDQNAREYFNSLPVLLQEQLTQSGVAMTTKEQLESYCKNALGESGKTGCVRQGMPLFLLEKRP